MDAQPSRPEPHFVGRFDHDNFEGARFAWPGSSVSARFVGTAIAAELDDSGGNRFCVLVDGQVVVDKLAPGRGRKLVTLARSLPPGEHVLSLVRLTEPLFGETEFFGFVVTGGTLLPYGAAHTRRLELIGDSISAGYGNEGERFDSPFSAETENHFSTYGALAARALGADLVTLAWSGKGVFSNAGSTVDTVPMPQLWRRTLPARPDSSWQFARYRPDAVLINLGTNDLSPSNPNHAPFANAYAAFVAEVRATYREADIFCLLGPALRDSGGTQTLSRARESLISIVDDFTLEGDSRVFFVELSEMNEREGYGCDYHPNLVTHARMATELERALRQALVW
jgi:Carbohydrate esterase 2 N-terminal/GDSL-like Lipase/Acylhydrolase family